MKLPVFITGLALVLFGLILRADPDTNNTAATTSNVSPPRGVRFLELFQPLRTAAATLSPDGRYIAYSVRNGDQTLVIIVDVEQPDKITTRVIIGSDDDASPMFSENDEKTPLEIRWMHWVTPTRLVLMTNHGGVFFRNPAFQSARSSFYQEIPFWDKNSTTIAEKNWLEDVAAQSSGNRSRRAFAALDTMDGWYDSPGTIMAIDADGKNGSILVRASDLNREMKYYAIEAMANSSWSGYTRGTMALSIFDFSTTDPESLIIQMRGERYPALFSLNVVTGKLKHLRNEIGESGVHPLFDRQGHLRGGIDNGAFSLPPFHYVLKKDGFITLGRWTKLDDVVGNTTNAWFTVTRDNYFSERAFPVGFDENPDLLYYASNVGRDTYGLYALNVRTGQRTDFAIEDPAVDLVEPPARGFNKSNLIFDRYERKLLGLRYDSVFRVTRWQKPEFDAVQKDLERSFPYCNVEILEWDRTASRFLALIHSVSNPGSYVLYEPAKKKAYDLTQRASWVEIGKRASVMPFTIVAEDGHKISGILTYPAAGRFPSVPVVVRCPTTPWLRAPREFQAESMALAQMGFAVLQLDSRGAWGSGIKRRESIKDGYERALVADIVTAVDKLATRFPINPQRVALIGESYGGFVALRAIQLAPDRFRCAASIDAPLDLAAWMENVRWTRHSTALELTRCYFGDTRSLKEVPLLRHPEKITKPVCLLTFPGDDGAQRTSIYLENRKFASALKRQGTPVEINELDKHFIGDIDSTLTASEPKSTVVELDREFAQRLPQAEAAVYRTLEYFLNAYIYDYQVKLGPLKTLPDVEN